MSEAAQAVESSEVQTVPQEVRDNAVGEEGEIGVEYEPLFDDEGPQTEADLTGDDPDAEPAKPPESKEVKDEDGKEAKPPQEKEGEKPDKEAADSEPEGDDKGKEAEKAKDDADKGKPPSGYVEIGALKEERGKHRETKQQLTQQAQQYEAEISRLNDELELARQQAPADRGKKDPLEDFKPLTLEEYEELVDEDPDEALKYQRREQLWKERRYQKAREQEAARQREGQIKAAIDTAMDEIEEILPGIYTAETPPETVRDLSTFATEKGKFPTGYLAALTRPDTQLVVKGANGKSRSVIMGPAAASIVRLIHGYKEASQADPESLRAEIEKEVTDRITQEVTEKVTRDLTLKFTGQEPDFRSISDAPRGKDSETADKEPSTEAEWANLSPAERRRLLGG